MLRRLLAVALLLALPALVRAQAPSRSHAATAKTIRTHGIATRVQGEVALPRAMADAVPGRNQQESVEDQDDQNNQQDVDEPDENEQEGLDEPDGPNHEEDANDAEDQDEDGDQAPAPAAAHKIRIGRHRP